jgi:hypothetical protein
VRRKTNPIPMAAAGKAASIANFVDLSQKAALTAQEIFGGITTRKYIIETPGTGVAIFDYDNDGWPVYCWLTDTFIRR